MTEPRFVNLDSHPVTVRDPQGHVRTVRPYRELAAFSWRKEADCVCTGQHYADFPGLLSPFPEAKQPDAPAASASPDGAGLAPKAPSGRFRGTGDVLGADGKLKEEGDPVVNPAAVAPPADPVPKDADPVEDETEDGDGDDPDQDVVDDRPVADIPGVTKALAAALVKAGYTSSSKVADCQSAKTLKKLGRVPGVQDAAALALAAQTLLGWEDVDEDS